MNRISLLLLATAFATTVSAQLKGDGYYRVQSAKQGRYVSVIDNRGSINMSSASADMGALRTVAGFERIVSDPSSVIYIKKMNSGYDLQSQGTGSYSIINYEIKITNLGDGRYWASASAAGMTKYLKDESLSWMWGADDVRRIIGQVLAVGTPTGDEADWYIKPVENDNYFGLTPTVSVGSDYYQSFYAAFPFTFASTGMNAYTVTKVDMEKAAVVINELTAGVPAATPVIVKCASAEPADNKLNVGASATSSTSGNLLTGVYFCNDVASAGHRNVVAYNAATMRVLGKAANGSLAFVKQANLEYIPANTAYLTVSADAPDELKVYTQEEYDAMHDPIEVKVVVDNATRKYGEVNPELTYTVTPADIDLTGKVAVSCAADAKSGVGDYPITVTVDAEDRMTVTCVNGTLTVTPAQLTVTVADAERVYGQENPGFAVSYAGFVNDETEAVLTEPAFASTEATTASGTGDYPIVVTAGKAANYDMACVNGTLTVIPAQLTVTATDVERNYGQENPDFTFIYAGFVNNDTEAVLTEPSTAMTEATTASVVGLYPIVVTAGKAANYELTAADGKLTVNKALLTVTANDAIRNEDEENPELTVAYEGFVNDEDESVLIVQPTVTTTATTGSPAGMYEIFVSGGEAANYDFAYKSGVLTVLPNATGVSSLPTNGQLFDVYDLKGRKVRSAITTLEDLPKGVYVIGGRKVVK